MGPSHRRWVEVVASGLAAGLVLVPLSAQADPTPGEEIADGNSGLIMVLDSSGSMAEADGSGQTRIESARAALGTAVDALPSEYPTGLRLYGSENSSCDDTTLAQPVEPVDRDAMKAALDAVDPDAGSTPTSLALTAAAEDLPQVPRGAIGRRTILLISDGESNCGEPPPCEVAAELAGEGVDLRIDTVGFQVGAQGREELECIAEAGHGTYYDAPDGAALGRELERAALLSADGYRFAGEELAGGESSGQAPSLEPGQYLDVLGPGETRWYAADLDADSTADFAVTGVPHPGVSADYSDGLELKLTESDDYPARCDNARTSYQHHEGAMILTQGVSRVPSADGSADCDQPGRYLLSVTRLTAESSDQAHWPIELRYDSRKPMPDGVLPPASEPRYGSVGPEFTLPQGDAQDIEGGTGFNDATELSDGVWRDRLLPAQTRFYKVPIGWGQQLRYRVEVANEPTLDGYAGSSYVDTVTYSPARKPVAAGDFTHERTYTGEPLAVDMGTVPVTWSNRWEDEGHVRAVRADGEYYLAVSLGPDTVRIAQNAGIGVTLRVEVAGDELAGPEHGAPTLAGGEDEDDSVSAADSAGDEGAGWFRPVTAGVAGGAAVALVASLSLTVVRRRRRTGAGADAMNEDTMRGDW